MKKIEFNNFRYSFVNSSLHGYKEILVTFTANGKNMHQIIFLEETKGTLNGTYIKEAKEEIDHQIKTGELLKKSKKSIKANVRKPLMVALSVAVAAGAVTGTYFITRHFTGGDTPAPVVTGHTVVLSAGIGEFATGSSYITLNNVNDGAILKDIKGYLLPIYGRWDFAGWYHNGTPFPDDAKISDDLLLIADFKKGVDALREEASDKLSTLMNEIESTLPIEVLLKIDPAIRTITDAGILTIQRDANDEDSIKQLTDLTSSFLNAIKEVETKEAANATAALFLDALTDALTMPTDLLKAADTAIINAATRGIVNAKSEISYEFIFSAYKQINSALHNVDPKNTRLIDLLSSIGSGAIEGMAYITNSSMANQIMAMADSLMNEYMNNKNFSDANVEELKPFLQDYVIAFAYVVPADMIKLVSEYYATTMKDYTDYIANPTSSQNYYYYQLDFSNMKSIPGTDYNSISITLGRPLLSKIRDACQNFPLEPEKIQTILTIAEALGKILKNGYTEEKDTNRIVSALQSIAAGCLNSYAYFSEIGLYWINALIDLPKPDSSKVTIAIPSLDNFVFVLTKTTNEYIPIVAKSSSPKSFNNIMILCKGLVDAARYSSFNPISSKMPYLSGNYDSFIKSIKADPTTDFEESARTFAGLIVNYSKIIGAKYPDPKIDGETIVTFLDSNLNGIFINTILGGLAKLTKDQSKLVIRTAEALQNSIFNCLPGLSYIYNPDDKAKYFNFCMHAISFMELQAKTDDYVYSNIIREYEALYGCETLFNNCPDPRMSADDIIKAKLELFDYFYDKSANPLYPYFEMYNRTDYLTINKMYTEEFFDKLTINMNLETIKQLAETAAEKIREYIGQ